MATNVYMSNDANHVVQESVEDVKGKIQYAEGAGERFIVLTQSRGEYAGKKLAIIAAEVKEISERPD